MPHRDITGILRHCRDQVADAPCTLKVSTCNWHRLECLVQYRGTVQYNGTVRSTVMKKPSDTRASSWHAENVFPAHCMKTLQSAEGNDPWFPNLRISTPIGHVEGIIVIIPDGLGWTFNNNRILAEIDAKRTNSRVYLPEFMDGHALSTGAIAQFDALEDQGGWMIGKMLVNCTDAG